MSIVDMWLEDYCKEHLKLNSLKLPVVFSYIDKTGKVSSNQIKCETPMDLVRAYLECHYYPDSDHVVILKADGTTIDI